MMVFALAAFTFAQPAPAPAQKADQTLHADVLLIVAHPDDELGGAALLAHAADQGGAAAVYCTSGNAGRNWVGPEQGPSLGRIREVEARMAEHAIGVNQVWFLEQPDTPSQNVMLSLGNWNHASTLRELVRLIRLLRPNTILTETPRTTSGENHGDHQAAAVSAVEAFDLAGDPTAFPEQLAAPREREDLLDNLKPWQPKQLLFFGMGSAIQSLPDAGPRVSMDDISPRTKESYGQMMADAWQWHRTQHRGGGGMSLGNTPNPPRPSPRTGSTQYFLAKDVGQPAPEAAPLPAFHLGGNWDFYERLWRAHHLRHVELLQQHNLSIQPGDTLRLPLEYENRGSEAVPVAVSCEIPSGWTAADGTKGEQTVAPHQTAEFVFMLKASAQDGANGTLSCSSTVHGQDAGKISITAGVSSRTMRQGIAAAER
ncbi:MAG TPA: PIG-L family deacetylase [Terriglobales bacterium]|nr:PIG-L family deacetylase [Terriglobales bacterium]